MKKLSFEAKKAFLLGLMCSISYLAVYTVRNILSAVTPQMLTDGFTTERIGSLSSVYFITYGIGQLINGAIGDKIKTKYMISFGVILAGICNVVFTAFADSYTVSYVAYAAMGFFLSMIYGPMTRLVAENTDLLYATRCSIGYTFASFFGSPLAGLLAMLSAWQSVFKVGSAMLFVTGILCFAVFTMFEHRGIIKNTKAQKRKAETGNISVLFKRGIVKFTMVSVLTGVVRTTVVFWLPTYLSQNLGYSSEKSAGIFTVATLVISASAFIAIFIYEKLKRRMNFTILIFFFLAAVFFAGVFFINQPAVNVILLVLAILSSNCASSVLWSVYCPSLADTGMVSTATGYLDFVSYMAASLSSKIFANAVGTIGWGNLILIWCALMVIGVLISFPYKKVRKPGM